MGKLTISEAVLLLGIFLADPVAAQDRTDQEAYEIARDAYIFAYPIVSMDITARQSTNVPDAKTVALRAPFNQFAHATSYPRAEDRDVVRYNFDTLYSSAWLDVSREPIVLSVPDTAGRYYLLPMLDMWTDVFAVVGSRTTGTKSGKYAIVAPGWAGTLPAGVVRITAPTPTLWILGRTQTNGSGDFDAVHRIQTGYVLTPLSQWGKPREPLAAAAVDPAIDNRTTPFHQVNGLSGTEMLTRLAALLQKHPPHANDNPILFRLKRIGFEAGKPFDATKLDATLASTINAAANDALKDIEEAGKTGEGLVKVNGWFYALQNVGTYGTSYKNRAMGAYIGLGVNLPEDAIYPASFVDGDGKPYDGSNRYTLHFTKEELPPADAFWSVTLYDKDGYQVANPLNRFAVGSHYDDNQLKFNADGSLVLYIQNERPEADKVSNWLPAPKGEFNLAMRLYSPQRAMRDGTWAPPPVKRSNGPS